MQVHVQRSPDTLKGVSPWSNWLQSKAFLVKVSVPHSTAQSNRVAHSYPVQGPPWMEDMNRFPNATLRVEFEGPEVCLTTFSALRNLRSTHFAAHRSLKKSSTRSSDHTARSTTLPLNQHPTKTSPVSPTSPTARCDPPLPLATASTLHSVPPRCPSKHPNHLLYFVSSTQNENRRTMSETSSRDIRGSCFLSSWPCWERCHTPCSIQSGSSSSKLTSREPLIRIDGFLSAG